MHALGIVLEMTGASVLGTQPHKGFVCHDAVQPGRKACISAEVSHVAQRLFKRRLDDVFGGENISRKSLRGAHEPRSELLVKRAKLQRGRARALGTPEIGRLTP